MPEALVDHAEVVQIEVQQRDGSLVLRGVRQPFLEAAAEECPIGKSRQLVVEGHAPQVGSASSDVERQGYALRHQREEFTIFGRECHQR